jgi:prolyl oligopeptidase
MPELMTSPPYSLIEPVTEILHGVSVTDPYRWLEDQDSPRTRAWIEAQTRYARAYLDSIPDRDRVHARIREFLAVETYDSVLPSGNRYFFRKRLPDQEQPSIYMREATDGEDQVLIDPEDRGTGKYTSVKPLKVSPDGRLLLYEVKEGGERTSTFELFDVEHHKRLGDVLTRGYLRGFAFAPQSDSFYYVHEALGASRPFSRAAYRHIIGTSFDEDREVFCAAANPKLRLYLVADETRLGFLVYSFGEKSTTDFYIRPFASESAAEAIVSGAEYMFGPLLSQGRLLAITDLNAPTLRIVEVHTHVDGKHEFVDLIRPGELRIQRWLVSRQHLVVSYVRGTRTEMHVYNLRGEWLKQLPINEDETVRLVSSSSDSEEVFLETESFTRPVNIVSYAPASGKRILWAEKTIPFEADERTYQQVWYTSSDDTQIPMFLFGKKDLLQDGNNPVVMTSYGGYGVTMTPQFSVFVSLMVERGCLFALPNIRGGSEFGPEWHTAAKRRNRQIAVDDFIAAGEYLIKTGRTTAKQLAIFGGSNSGLLVGAALTQRPELFRAVLCMVPLLDMLRYHHFNGAYVWAKEFGTADYLEDFTALAQYSPYHRVRDRIAYPSVMMVSGDADQNCNPLHARKMTARLQAANVSPYPIFLDYTAHRGHSPVLPLSERINALTDRIAFLCDQLCI